MKFFKAIEMNLAACFYYPNQTRMLIGKRLLGLVSGLLCVFANILFLIFDAGNAREYVISAFMLVTGAGICISFIDTCIKTTQIFSLVGGCVEAIEKGKHYQPSDIDVFKG